MRLCPRVARAYQRLDHHGRRARLIHPLDSLLDAALVCRRLAAWHVGRASRRHRRLPARHVGWPPRRQRVRPIHLSVLLIRLTVASHGTPKVDVCRLLPHVHARLARRDVVCHLPKQSVAEGGVLIGRDAGGPLRRSQHKCADERMHVHSVCMRRRDTGARVLHYTVWGGATTLTVSHNSKRESMKAVRLRVEPSRTSRSQSSAMDRSASAPS